MIPLFLALAALTTVEPRYQWNENHGYCGEVCFITAGLNYGQYMSQYDARNFASPGMPQDQGQLLLGMNATQAAEQMHLKAEEWDSSQGDFFAWVKDNINNGNSVSIGVYMNQYLFYDDTDPDAGDADYDHIVVVTDVDGTKISFSDNGVWSDPSKPPQYFFSATPATREQANAQDGAIYSLPLNDYCGISLSGTIDATLPVKVETSVNYERPEIADKSNTRPTSMPLTLTVTVSNLQPNVSYNLSRYNDFTLATPVQQLPIQISSGSTYTTTQQIQSDEITIYRCTEHPSKKLKHKKPPKTKHTHQ